MIAPAIITSRLALTDYTAAHTRSGTKKKQLVIFSCEILNVRVLKNYLPEYLIQAWYIFLRLYLGAFSVCYSIRDRFPRLSSSGRDGGDFFQALKIVEGLSGPRIFASRFGGLLFLRGFVKQRVDHAALALGFSFS